MPISLFYFWSSCIFLNSKLFQRSITTLELKEDVKEIIITLFNGIIRFQFLEQMGFDDFKRKLVELNSRK